MINTVDFTPGIVNAHAGRGWDFIKTYASCLLALLLGDTAVQGAILLRDDFNYADGPLVQVAQGVWSTHSGNPGEVEVTAGQLILTQTESEDVNALLAGRPYSAKGSNVFYVRFQVNFTALPSGRDGAYFAHFKDGGNGFRCRIYATTNSAAPGSFRLGLANSSNAASVLYPTDLTLHSSHLVIARMAVSEATSSLWLDPVGEGDLSVTSTDGGSPISVAAFAFRQSLSSGYGIGTLSVDDLVIADSFADLILRQNVRDVRISCETNNQILLRWTVAPDQSYTIWQADSLTTGFQKRASGLQFPLTQPGQFMDDRSTNSPQRFYWITTP